MKEYTLKISRFNPEIDRAPVFKEYQVPYVDDDSVLGALLYIYEEIDSTLLFSYGCRYRICGKCAIRINGKPALACETRVEDGMVLEPLDNLPVIRDLAVDRTGLIEPLRRLEILLSPLKEVEAVSQPSEFYQLMRCNECLSCLSSCPVFKAEVGYDGPFMGTKLAQLYYDVREGKKSLSDLENFLDGCIQCQQCEVHCPWDVPFSKVSTKIKGEIFKGKGVSFRDWFMSRPPIIGWVASMLSSPMNALTRRKLVRRMIDRLMKIDERAPFPSYQKAKIRRQKGEVKNKVAYLIGCYEKFNDPVSARDSLSILEAIAPGVEILDPGCCGIPFIGIGNLESARKRAVAASELLTKRLSEGYEVVFGCPSCGSMIKNEYPALFGLLGEQNFRSRIYDIGEYLLQRYQLGQFKMTRKGMGEKIGYQISCHLKALKIGTPSLHLLREIPGLEVEVFDQCCGMAGMMGFKKERFDLSQRVGTPLMEEIKKGQLKRIVSDCSSCRMKIEHETGLKTVHPISLIKEAVN